jgi:hypothetical protein
MRDPCKPKRVRLTGWGLRFRDEENEQHGSPVHTWFLFTGFVMSVVSWLASFWRVPTMRSVGGTEKAVVVDAAERHF